MPDVASAAAASNPYMAAITGGLQVGAGIWDILNNQNLLQWLHGMQAGVYGTANNNMLPPGQGNEMLLNLWNPVQNFYNQNLNNTQAGLWGAGGQNGGMQNFQDWLNSYNQSLPQLFSQFNNLENNPIFNAYRGQGQQNYNNLAPYQEGASSRFTQGSPFWQEGIQRTNDWFNGLDPALATLGEVGTSGLENRGQTAWNQNLIDTLGSTVSNGGWNGNTQNLYNLGEGFARNVDPSITSLLSYLGQNLGTPTSQMNQLGQASQGLYNTGAGLLQNSGFSPQASQLFSAAMQGTNTNYDPTALTGLSMAQSAASNNPWAVPQVQQLFSGAQNMLGGNTPQMNQGFGQGSNLFDSGGFTPQMNTFMQNAQNYLNPNSVKVDPQMQSFLGSTLAGVQNPDAQLSSYFSPEVISSYQSAITGGGGTDNTRGLWEAINALSGGGGGTGGYSAVAQASPGSASFSPVSMTGHSGMLDDAMSTGFDAFKKGAPMSNTQALSLVRDQAATANAQQAQAALARATARGGGAGAIGSGIGNNVLTDFADAAATNEASALRDALFKQQDARMNYGIAGGNMANNAAQTQASYANGINSANAGLAQAALNAGTQTSIANANLADAAANRALQARLGGVNAGVNLAGQENERFLGAGNQLTNFANAGTERLNSNIQGFLGGQNQLTTRQGQNLQAGTNLANSLISGGNNNLATAAGLMSNMVDAGNTRSQIGAGLGSNLAQTALGTQATNTGNALSTIPQIMNANTNRFGTAQNAANQAISTAAGREGTGLSGMASGVSGMGTNANAMNNLLGTQITGITGANQTAQSGQNMGLNAMFNSGQLANNNLSTALTEGNQASKDQIARMNLAAQLLGQNVTGRQNAMTQFNNLLQGYDTSQLGFGNLGMGLGNLGNTISNTNWGNDLGLIDRQLAQFSGFNGANQQGMSQLANYLTLLNTMQNQGLTGLSGMGSNMLQYIMAAGPQLMAAALNGATAGINNNSIQNLGQTLGQATQQKR